AVAFDVAQPVAHAVDAERRALPRVVGAGDGRRVGGRRAVTVFATDRDRVPHARVDLTAGGDVAVQVDAAVAVDAAHARGVVHVFRRVVATVAVVVLGQQVLVVVATVERV